MKVPVGTSNPLSCLRTARSLSTCNFLHRFCLSMATFIKGNCGRWSTTLNIAESWDSCASHKPPLCPCHCKISMLPSPSHFLKKGNIGNSTWRFTVIINKTKNTFSIHTLQGSYHYVARCYGVSLYILSTSCSRIIRLCRGWGFFLSSFTGVQRRNGICFGLLDIIIPSISPNSDIVPTSL